MILENRTRYRTADLEAVILAALAEAGLGRGSHDRVVVVYGTGFSGWCFKGRITRWNGHARMRLRVPRPSTAGAQDGWTFDVTAFVWLVRHEVGHWRGLDHSQMHPLLRDWKPWQAAGKPLPAWAADLSVAIEDTEPDLRKPRPTADAKREAKIEHARTMLAKSERKAKLADTLVKRWARRVAAAERAIAKAATRVP